MSDFAGHVWIAGAGPGDAGLLTLAAAHALAGADVVVYDALVEPSTLHHAREGAELVYAGKRAGRQAMSQDDINAFLVHRAQRGERVVRLKGGDPFVFGRGGEEALACRDANVGYTIVPGISSALAAPAYAGIPVTHRAVAESFLVITAQAADGREPRWEVAAAADTIVVLMGREKLAQVCARLIEAGKPPDTPAASIRWGTRHDQQTIHGTLASLPQLADDARLESPIVTVVGQVAALASQLAWFDPGPLAGKSVVVTRARDQASGLAERLAALGAHVVEAPVIHTQPTLEGAALHQALLDRPDWILFASASGVRSVFAALQECGKDARALAGSRIAAIGEATRDTLSRWGLLPDFVPSRATAVALGSELPGEPGNSVLFLCSSLTDQTLASTLRERGMHVRQLVAYETSPQPLDEQTVREILDADAVTFTSGSTARNLRASLPSDCDLPRAALISMGEQTSAAVREAFGRVDREASEPTLDALAAATIEALR